MLSHASSFSISSASIFRNFVIQLFPTTILWVHLVKLSTEHISSKSPAKSKWFQDKIQIKMNFSILGKHKTVNRKSRHDWSNLNVWEFYSFINRNRVFDFKTMQYFMKRSMHGHMWLNFAVPLCNYRFDFFLTFWL